MSESDVSEVAAKRRKMTKVIDHIDYDAEVTATKDEAIEAIIAENEECVDAEGDGDEEDSDAEIDKLYHCYDDVEVSDDDRESDGSWRDTSDESDFDVEPAADQNETVPEVVDDALSGGGDRTESLAGSLTKTSSVGTGMDGTVKSSPAPDIVSEASKRTEKQLIIQRGIKKIMDSLQSDSPIRHVLNLKRSEVKRLTENGLKRRIACMSKKQLKNLRQALENADFRKDFKADLDGLERLNMPERGEYFFTVCCAIFSAALYGIIFSIFLQRTGIKIIPE